MNHSTIHKRQRSGYLYPDKALRLSRTLHKSALFMQNKPNFLNTRINLSSILTKPYENNRLPTSPQKQTQSNPTSDPNFSLFSAERSEVPIYRESIRKQPPAKPKSPAPALLFAKSPASPLFPCSGNGCCRFPVRLSVEDVRRTVRFCGRRTLFDFRSWSLYTSIKLMFAYFRVLQLSKVCRGPHTWINSGRKTK